MASQKSLDKYPIGVYSKVTPTKYPMGVYKNIGRVFMCMEYNEQHDSPHCKHTQRDEDKKKQDPYCNDILVQSAAVSAALNSFNRELLENHVRHCVARDIREGKDEVIDELMGTLKKLMK